MASQQNMLPDNAAHVGLHDGFGLQAQSNSSNLTGQDVMSDYAWMGKLTGSDYNGSDPVRAALPMFPMFGNDSTFMSKDEIEKLLKDNHQLFMLSSHFDTTTQIALIVAYAILIVFGATGNGLVCYVVAKNPHMRTPRNIFIINLAISDLTLCLFTQPFNLMKVSMPVWKLGNFMCKFIPMFAGTNVFVTTISITAIALDRFQVIVYPTKDNMRKVGAVVALVSIWTISLLMASPLLIFSVTQGVEPYQGVIFYEVCVENPDLHYEKAAYSIASMIFQYIVPIAIVIVAHARICNKLKYRMVNQQTAVTTAVSPFVTRKKAAEAKRKRKTNLLLVFIGLVFACSWMPLNIFNIMADFDLALLQSFDSKSLVFPICHLLVLGSACTNPVLYGWLNENFRKEFLNVLCCKNIKVLFQCKNICHRNKSGNGRGQTSVMIYTKASNGTTKTTTEGGNNIEMQNVPNNHVNGK